jgi:phosphoglycolate phosphatase
MLHIIWDLDGTLIDSGKEISRHVRRAVEQAGFDPARMENPFAMGPTIYQIIRSAFSEDEMDEVALNKTVSLFRSGYDNSGFEETRPFPGIEEIISDNSNFTHHIVTNKPDNPTKKILEKLHWSGYIASVITPYTKLSADGKRRSKAELFADVIAEFGGDKSQYIGIGDMITDCVAAKENSITAAGVLWGAGAREELQSCCDYIFENIKQLYEFLHKRRLS